MKYDIVITKIVDDPRMKGRKLLFLDITDIESKDTWRREVSVLAPERPISLEEWKLSLTPEMIEKPVKPFKYIEEAIKKKTKIRVEFKGAPQDN